MVCFEGRVICKTSYVLSGHRNIFSSKGETLVLDHYLEGSGYAVYFALETYVIQ